MDILTVFLCADHAGRVDYDMMPDQTLMELLVEGIQKVSPFQDDYCVFRDIKTWEGVTLDEDGNVCDIAFGANVGILLFGSSDEIDQAYIIGPEGTIDMRWVPRHVKCFDVSSLNLSGSLETSVLPRVLINLDLSTNKLCGTVAFESLPPSMTTLTLYENNFSGTLKLEALPRTMVSVHVGSNDFEGSLVLTNLPEAIVTLRLSANNFSGTIDMSNIPSTLQNFGLYRTNIKQHTLVIRLGEHGVKYFQLGSGFEKIVDTNGENPFKTSANRGFV